MMLILTEAGEGIGFGHLTRMMALGEALIEMALPVRMLVQWEGPVQPQVIEGREWVLAGEWRDAPVGVIEQFQASAVVVDSYRLFFDAYQAIANAGVHLTAIDDYHRLPYPAGLVVNPNVYADTSRYLDSARHAVGGVEYVILRPAFVRAAGSFSVRPELRRVLLTLGGSDVHSLGLPVAGSLATIGREVYWIAPALAPFDPPPTSVTIYGTQGMEGMVQLVRDCDLVVCGGGQTLHELACLGAPCIALELGDDQLPNLNFYEQTGLLGPRLRWSQENLLAALADRMESLRPAAARSRLSLLGRELIDGEGVRRLARVIAAQTR
ncbi:MAG: hypothetical protein JWO08_3872 [Verrucomicrobiaceae bacterium]|nr:hypothetical protein [Verrucomicrobiaceae bacterium]